MKRIQLIATGGTIASTEDGSGPFLAKSSRKACPRSQGSASSTSCNP